MQCHRLAGVPQLGCGGGGGGLGEGGGGDGDGSAEGEPQSSSTSRVRMPPVSRREYLSIPQTELQTGGRHITTNRRRLQTAQARSESTTINTNSTHYTSQDYRPDGHVSLLPRPSHIPHTLSSHVSRPQRSSLSYYAMSKTVLNFPHLVLVDIAWPSPRLAPLAPRHTSSWLACRDENTGAVVVAMHACMMHAVLVRPTLRVAADGVGRHWRVREHGRR